MSADLETRVGIVETRLDGHETLCSERWRQSTAATAESRAECNEQLKTLGTRIARIEWGIAGIGLAIAGALGMFILGKVQL